ncbi:hypothetical protein HAV38_18565 [Glaciimonas immobilis]|uniref:hypothetical protein n=1 Tax=Glaciimonas immobilis TaxID=728004 RepID=UPI00143A0D75|nr:hypothetical protein [Glaciimonas immobilis]KAF3996634.1 hypothetical protein HAV38_18565 [Glaciimonas immobilis]
MVSAPWMLAGSGPAASYFFLASPRKSNQKEGDRRGAALPLVGSPIISTISRVEIPTRWRSNMYSDNSRLTAEITGITYDGAGQQQPQPPQPC